MSVIKIGEGALLAQQEPPKERKFANFITAYMEYTKEIEATPRINLWTALSITAGVLERKVWIDESYGRIFPNLYTVIVGPAGITRKSTATAMGVELIRAVSGVNMLAQRVTEAALAEALKRAYKTATIEGREYKHSSIFCYSSELSTLLKDTNGIVVDYLTDLFDCGPRDSEKPWVKETKGEGQVRIFGPCPNILACTTPRQLRRMLPVEQLEAGFASRVMFVFEPTPASKFTASREPNAWEIQREKDLINDLAYINQIAGKMRRTKGAADFYNSWYETFRMKSTQNIDERFSGYYGRKPLLVNKLSMVMSAAQRDNLIIEEDDIKAALRILDTEEPYIFKLLGFSGANQTAEITYKIVEFIKRSRRVNLSQIGIKFFQDLDNKQLGEVLKHLSDMNLIQQELQGSQVFYSATADAENLIRLMLEPTEAELL